MIDHENLFTTFSLTLKDYVKRRFILGLGASVESGKLLIFAKTVDGSRDGLK